MSTDILAKGLSLFKGSNAVSLVPTNQGDMFNTQIMDANRVVSNVQAASARNMIQLKQFVKIEPQTAVSASLINGGVITFRITTDLLTRLDHGFLKVTVANTTTTDMTISADQLCLRRKEISYPGGGILYEIEGEEFWLENCLYTRVQWENNAAAYGSTGTYGPGANVIPASSSKDLYFPLLGLLVSANFCLPALQDDLEIKFTFKNANEISLAGVIPTVSAASLELLGYNEPPVLEKLRLADYTGEKSLIRYIAHKNVKQTYTLQPNTTYDMQLNGLRGMCAGLFIVQVPFANNPYTSNGIWADYIQSFDINGSNGSSILGSYARNMVENRLIYAHDFENSFNRFTNFIWVPFCEAPLNTIATGSNTGFFPFEGIGEVLRFTTNASVGANAVCQIQVRALIYTNIEINNRRLRRIDP